MFIFSNQNLQAKPNIGQILVGVLWVTPTLFDLSLGHSNQSRAGASISTSTTPLVASES
jgi:hypothetical protein